MATATEMTLALGRTVYGGDPSGEPQSDERIVSREVRVSVTWRLDEEEQNLPLMVSVLAEEAARALEEADRTAHLGLGAGTAMEAFAQAPAGIAQATRQQLPSSEGSAGGVAAPISGIPQGGGHYPSYPGFPGRETAVNGATGNGEISHGEATNGASGNGAPGSSPVLPTAASSHRYVPAVTKAQRLAIQSHCTRHGVADWELRRLVWERFGKKSPEELNKDQAAELLTALQQEGWRNEPPRPAYAN